MNQPLHPDRLSDVPWPTSGDRLQASDLPTLPGGSSPPSDVFERTVPGAAAAAEPIGESLSAAGDAIRAKAAHLREARDEWARGARSAVRRSPLVSVAAAMALGAVIARITR